MSGNYVKLDVSRCRAFFETVGRAAKGDFRRDMELFLEGIGFEFLRIVEDEIIRRKALDTRLLLHSFDKGSEGNVWEIKDGGLALEVGSSVKYAGYVNDGHWTNPKGVAVRWVPGRWEGDRFIYDADAKTGMALKQRWVEGAHFWESALRILDKIFPKLLDEKLQEWLNKSFGR
jgi:hypothetical protein